MERSVESQDLPAGAHWNIDVLGTLTVHRNGQRCPEVSPLRSAVVVLLALAGRRGCSAQELQLALGIRSKNALEQHLTELRRIGLPIPKYGVLRSDGYALDFSRVRVDAVEWKAGVDTLGDAPDAAELSRLLMLWRENPIRAHPLIDPARWNSVLRVVEVMPDERRRSIDGLAEFIELFPEDAGINRLRSLLRQERRKRLLIVEDMSMEYVIDALGPTYTCVPVADRRAWRRLLEQTDGVPDVDAALIDLHLTSGLTDEHGLDIAEWLRDNTEIPAALMTMALPPTGDLESWTRKQRARYRLVKIVHKGVNGLNTVGIREAAEYLTGQAEHHHRARLEAWFESHRYRVEEGFFGRPRTEARREAEFRRAALRVGDSVAHRPLAEARDAVTTFHDTWCPRH